LGRARVYSCREALIKIWVLELAEELPIRITEAFPIRIRVCLQAYRNSMKDSPALAAAARPTYVFGRTMMFNGSRIVYGDPGAWLTLVGVIVNTNNFPDFELIA
jgi:hypothetical protein